MFNFQSTLNFQTKFQAFSNPFKPFWGLFTPNGVVSGGYFLLRPLTSYMHQDRTQYPGYDAHSVKKKGRGCELSTRTHFLFFSFVFSWLFLYRHSHSPLASLLSLSPAAAASGVRCPSLSCRQAFPQLKLKKKRASCRAAVLSTYDIASQPYALVFIPAFSHAAVLKRVHEALRGCSPGIPRGQEYERVSRL